MSGAPSHPLPFESLAEDFFDGFSPPKVSSRSVRLKPAGKIPNIFE
jgi:hypothetical protein